jgi:outer membrane protein OmpA-like peptidoglycan-associated protein
MPLKNKVLLVLLLSCLSQVSFAQKRKKGGIKKQPIKEVKDTYNTWSLGMGLSSLKTSGDLSSYSSGNIEGSTNLGFYIYGNKMFNPIVGLEVKIDYNSLGAAGQGFTGNHAIKGIDENLYGNQVLSMNGNKFGFEINGILNFNNLWKLNSKNWSWSLIAGLGNCYYSTKLYDENKSEILSFNNSSALYFDTGLDVKYRLNRRIDISLRPSINSVYADDFDATISSKNSYESYFSTHLGIVYKFGKEKRHAIWANNEDIGEEKFQVVDTDKDGVIDEVDKEPETPSEAMVYGSGISVDSDMDGVPDYKDKCPFIRGIEINDGCPEDRDGDGVYDFDDVCPDIKGVAENLGCPRENHEEEITNRIFLLAKSIYFKSNSDQIIGDSYTILNEIANIMLQYPNTQFAIDGHSDNTGEASYNLYLSKKRAISVQKYLGEKGVNETRLYAEGFGITQPAYSNKSLDGRKRNRRVEINYIQPDSKRGIEIYEEGINPTESINVIQPNIPINLKDSDGDGVADILDKEPNTPQGALVYGNGVAIDTDKDGISDHLDGCPLIYGTLENNGCSETPNQTGIMTTPEFKIKDSDKDGVMDLLDTDNNTPIGAKVYGNGVAIDTDNDGVIDFYDKCPLKPGPKNSEGCSEDIVLKTNNNQTNINDTDGDGVIDALDKEPNTPVDARVYGNGVSVDTDGDGIPDHSDTCSLKYGAISNKGCPISPDSDGDGVPNEFDKEPNTQFGVKVYGNGVSMDTDNDGTPDHLDACPLKPGSASTAGCPKNAEESEVGPITLADSDNDGVMDQFDDEPNTPKGAKVYGNGVSVDSDNDGIPDYKDECPNTSGTNELNGCAPKEKDSNINLGLGVASNITTSKQSAINMKDSDNDGVMDQFDKEKNTPKGAKVYGNGVSVDSDNDGIPDHKDKCPNISGTKALNGCAPKKNKNLGVVSEGQIAKQAVIEMKDSDNDGVMDQFDKEKNTPKGAKVYGNGVSVDSDNDGIPDHKDKCPNISGTKALSGCAPRKNKNLGVVSEGQIAKQPVIEMKDSDNDGVMDQFDKEKNTPKGAKVYGNGVSVDSDNDGIPDHKDKCPLKSGTVENEGCPKAIKEFDWADDDNDGVVNEFDKEPNTPAEARVYGNGVAVDSDFDNVPDHIDECPFEAGSVENKGCTKIEGAIDANVQDTDKDGVLDLYDEEPNTPYGVKVYSNGVAIDSDKDKVPDYKDKCPRTKGLLENEGCPALKDLDGDGVTDTEDLCPEVPGIATKQGCPEKNFDKSAYIKIESLSQKIKFQKTKNTLTNQTMDILDNILKIMEEYPATKFEIASHTDNKHNEKYSLFLSKRRANAIMKYLIDGGINEDRLTSEGYGDTKPKYSNTLDLATSELNNRIEFNFLE